MAAKLSALRAIRFSTPGRFLVLISVRGWVDPRVIVQMEELRNLKKSTSSGLKTATCRLVAQCLNQLRYCLPHSWYWHKELFGGLHLDTYGSITNLRFTGSWNRRHKISKDIHRVNVNKQGITSNGIHLVKRITLLWSVFIRRIFKHMQDKTLCVRIMKYLLWNCSFDVLSVKPIPERDQTTTQKKKSLRGDFPILEIVLNFNSIRTVDKGEAL
jgi:hypothetical protein